MVRKLTKWNIMYRSSPPSLESLRTLSNVHSTSKNINEILMRPSQDHCWITSHALKNTLLLPQASSALPLPGKLRALACATSCTCHFMVAARKNCIRQNGGWNLSVCYNDKTFIYSVISDSIHCNWLHVVYINIGTCAYVYFCLLFSMHPGSLPFD